MRLVPALSHDSSSGKTAAGSGRSMAILADEKAMVPDLGPARRDLACRRGGPSPAGSTLPTLHRAPGDQHLVALVAVLELVAAEVARAQALQEGGRGEHVAVRLGLGHGRAPV